jgi:hypothetical protein
MPLSQLARNQIAINEVEKALWIGSEGRLCPYEPVVAVEGLELLVKWATSPATIGLEPKGAFARDKNGNVKAFVRGFSFVPSPFRYVVVIEILPRTLAPGPYTWALRADVFARMVPAGSAGFTFSASPEEGSKDKFTPFRYPPLELAGVVETALEQVRVVGLKKPLPSNRAEVVAARKQLGLAASLPKRRDG